MKKIIKESKGMKIENLDILGNFDLKIDIKKSEPACMLCLPSKSLDGHKIINGIMVHERINCPK